MTPHDANWFRCKGERFTHSEDRAVLRVRYAGRADLPAIERALHFETLSKESRPGLCIALRAAIDRLSVPATR